MTIYSKQLGFKTEYGGRLKIENLMNMRNWEEYIQKEQVSYFELW